MSLTRARLLRGLMLLAFAVVLWRFVTHVLAHRTRPLVATFLTPSPPTFAIWGVVYACLGLFLARDCICARDIALPLALSALVSVAFLWTVVWLEMCAAGFLALLLLPLSLLWLTLAAAYVVVDIAIAPLVLTSLLFSDNLSPDEDALSASSGDFACVRLPMALWWAWVSCELLLACQVALAIDGLRVYVFWLGIFVVANVALLLGTGDLVVVVVALWFLWGVATGPKAAVGPFGVAVQAMASLGAFVLGGLVCLLVLHKAWRGPKTAAAPLLTLSGQQRSSSYISLSQFHDAP
ncbi:Aste57867_19832 [Aphanomyces stellatus]|uniref:Aste57867_19832 protein n=1 Tax=Aphanomyces stellatus TaxID=120398 RepID=A0A485LDJ3_9STRA|nr:hypothetical protein As57867_019767 [Aphanomyces stellatus]VFT96530.1 Aste57867_19832 [Aphanomyces stellatus]